MILKFHRKHKIGRKLDTLPWIGRVGLGTEFKTVCCKIHVLKVENKDPRNASKLNGFPYTS